MSAAVCGKRSFFEDIESSPSPTSASSQAYKKFRCSSPVLFSYSPPVVSDRIDRLKDLFPSVEVQLLEKAMEESGDDLDTAIKMLRSLCLEYSNGSSDSIAQEFTKIGKGVKELTSVNAVPLEDPEVLENLPSDGAQWVDLFVTEMMTATSIDDARHRAARVLERLEKSISSRTISEASQNFNKENFMVKEQTEALFRDNIILKRAVSIQHGHLKEKDDEVLNLKQMLAQYKEQLRNLEVNNYGLKLQLRQAEQGNSIPGRFLPDVY